MVMISVRLLLSWIWVEKAQGLRSCLHAKTCLHLFRILLPLLVHFQEITLYQSTNLLLCPFLCKLYCESSFIFLRSWSEVVKKAIKMKVTRLGCDAGLHQDSLITLFSFTLNLELNNLHCRISQDQRKPSPVTTRCEKHSQWDSFLPRENKLLHALVILFTLS